MNKGNKPRIPLNRKEIDELHSDNKNKGSFDTQKAPEESISPFEEDTEFTFHSERESFDTDGVENPFQEEKSADTDPSNPNFSEEPYDTPSPEPDEMPKRPNLELAIDPETPYFFVFGNSTAGKSAMLSGLLYYIKTGRIGQLQSLSINDQVHHRQGDYIIGEMTRKVRRGEFIEGTQTLDRFDNTFPTEINLEFQPDHGPNMPFCLLEMAGEDLREIELRDQGRAGGKFDERINAYLKHPDCKLIFICVLDVDSPEDSEDLIDGFLTYIDKIGHDENPILISINKWDKVADKYDDARDYIKQNLPILETRLLNPKRPMAYMKFSVGDVQVSNGKDTYKFIPDDSKILLEWMYETATGASLGQEVKKSVGGKTFKSIKNIFK